jgi:hypothetical protein
MKPTQDKYPVFEANQVLSNAHLNQTFSYSDEQVRLSRANLIGIGVVCGLEIDYDGQATKTTINLSKGCGITSEGYLIIEPDNVALVSYRKYNVPDNLGYAPFTAIKKLELWELFPASEPDPINVLDHNFLSDKAVLLFLELKKEGLRNCSPNNCDDKGSAITVTVRRLLIKKVALKQMIDNANKLSSSLSFTDFEAELAKRLALPGLHLPRYDVKNTLFEGNDEGEITAGKILGAFQMVFIDHKLVTNVSEALNSAYDAFRSVLPVLNSSSNSPFAGFFDKFKFLQEGMLADSDTRINFLQYYYDFFDDLIRAYDEFRWKGLELMCACCPPEGLFPRHLMLGVLTIEKGENTYRHSFLPSPAVDNCEEAIKVLRQLFQRLVQMIEQFTDKPLLPSSTSDQVGMVMVLAQRNDMSIRITPSKLGDVPLSDKAIPYYYKQDGKPPLYQLWSPEKTRRGKANQNLSYRSDSNEYNLSDADRLFYVFPNSLSYDLEPYNFLRIEGHLGQDAKVVEGFLKTKIKQYRLPIEILRIEAEQFQGLPAGIQHKAGVPIGGVFIIVCQREQ